MGQGQRIETIVVEIDTYLESAEEGRVTNRAQTVQALIVRWEALSSMAYPVDKSRDLIHEVMKSYG